MINPSHIPGGAAQALSGLAGLSVDGPVEVVLALQSLVPPPPQPEGAPAPPQGPLNLRRLNPRDVLMKEFRTAMRTAGADAAVQVLIPYEAGRALSPHEVFYVPLSDVSMLARLIEQSSAPAGIQIYAPGRDVEHPTVSVISLSQSGGATAHFVRGVSPQLRLTTGRFVAAVLGDGAFDRLKEEVLLFDRLVDAICVGQHVYVIRPAGFERLFGYLEELRVLAGTTFDQVTAQLTIVGLQDLRDNCTRDINMMRKVASIAARMRADSRHLSAMTMAGLLQFLDANPQIAAHVPLRGVGAARELVFESGLAERWRILKLLDDDYLKSGLTDIDYEANSKSRLANG